MKRLLTIAAALVFGVLTVTFTSCGSHTGTIIYPNSMSATVGGVLSFSANGSYITATKVNGTLNIYATASSNAKIAMIIPSFSPTVGTLAITDVGLPVSATYDSLGNGTLLVASTGSITFNKVSPYLEGTFNFVCRDSMKVTNGTFKIKAP